LKNKKFKIYQILKAGCGMSALIVINEKIKGTQSNPIRKPRLKSLKNSPTKRLTATSQSLINQVNKNADSNAEFSILLSGVKSLTTGDFVL
jgi:hypothetical protein